MITLPAPATTSRAAPLPQQRFVIRQSSWQTYQTLLKAFEDSPVRVTFDRGALELLSPSGPHERLKKLLDRLISAAAEELEISLRSQGSTTFSREELNRGLEPDECYYIEHEPDVRDRDDVGSDAPPPDLAVEVEVSRTALDRMGIYADLGVPEVWRLSGTDLVMLRLDESGSYREVDRSEIFPQIPRSVFTELLDRRFETTELKLVRDFRRWIQDNIS
ncbi:MAG: Uma2 family endonuclease [Planctomycetaceae bacterium]|nr:Uma2 family endonuclease [Planctomycetaceae bacterium]